MAANDELKVRCPYCGAKYRVPASAIGRKLRCAKCKSAFRVTDSRGDSHRSPSPAPPSRSPVQPSPSREAKRFPSEDDILRWLSEADDDSDRERRAEMSLHDSDASLSPSTSEPAFRPTAGPASPPESPRLRVTSSQDDPDDVLMLRRVV